MASSAKSLFNLDRHDLKNIPFLQSKVYGFKSLIQIHLDNYITIPVQLLQYKFFLHTSTWILKILTPYCFACIWRNWLWVDKDYSLNSTVVSKKRCFIFELQIHKYQLCEKFDGHLEVNLWICNYRPCR